MLTDPVSLWQFLSACGALVGFVGMFVSWCFMKQLPESAYDSEKMTADFTKVEYYHPAGKIINRLAIALWALGGWGFIVAGGRQSKPDGLLVPSTLLLVVLAVGIAEMLVAVLFMRSSRETDEIAEKTSDYFTFQGWKLVRVGAVQVAAAVLGILLIRL